MPSFAQSIASHPSCREMSLKRRAGMQSPGGRRAALNRQLLPPFGEADMNDLTQTTCTSGFRSSITACGPSKPFCKNSTPSAGKSPRSRAVRAAEPSCRRLHRDLRRSAAAGGGRRPRLRPVARPRRTGRPRSPPGRHQSRRGHEPAALSSPRCTIKSRTSLLVHPGGVRATGVAQMTQRQQFGCWPRRAA